MLGIDEAGRGPAIGPLVVAGVRIAEKDKITLKKLGVRDSKLVSPKERTFLAERIGGIALWTKAVSVDANEIDEKMKRMSLNDIELEAMAEIINSCELLDGEDVIIDLPSNGPEFGRVLRTKIKNKKINLILEHSADKNHVCVGAASIIAKEGREKQVAGLHLVHGDFGSGYPHDPKTKKFLQKAVREKTSLEIIRTSWATVKDIQGSAEQRKLF